MGTSVLISDVISVEKQTFICDCLAVWKYRGQISNTTDPQSQQRWWGHRSSGNYAAWGQSASQSSSSPSMNLCSNHRKRRTSPPWTDCPRTAVRLVLEDKETHMRSDPVTDAVSSRGSCMFNGRLVLGLQWLRLKYHNSSWTLSWSFVHEPSWLFPRGRSRLVDICGFGLKCLN